MFPEVVEVILGGLVVIALSIGPKIRGLKPGRGDGFLSAIKIRSTHSFGEEVMPPGPCRNISCGKAKFSFLLPIPPACYQMTLLVGLPESSRG
jgi:hypothetical protein